MFSCFFFCEFAIRTWHALLLCYQVREFGSCGGKRHLHVCKFWIRSSLNELMIRRAMSICHYTERAGNKFASHLPPIYTTRFKFSILVFTFSRKRFAQYRLTFNLSPTTSIKIDYPKSQWRRIPGRGAEGAAGAAGRRPSSRLTLSSRTRSRPPANANDLLPDPRPKALAASPASAGSDPEAAAGGVGRGPSSRLRSLDQWFH